MGFGLGNGFNSSRFKSTIYKRCSLAVNFSFCVIPRYPDRNLPVEPLHANNLFAVCDERSFVFRMTPS